MKFISFIYLQLIFITYSLCDSQERYTRLGKQLFSSLQSFLSFEKTAVVSPDGEMALNMSNIRLITPVLSKINYEFNETEPSQVKAKNAVFTFVVDISSEIQKSNIGTLNIPDFLFQLTCDSFEFSTKNKRVTELKNSQCNELYFSTDNALGKLKTFSFFSESNQTKEHLTNYFYDIISHKVDDNLQQKVNLINIDIENIMSQVSEYYKGIILDKKIENYIIHNMTMDQFTYSKMKVDTLTNMVTYEQSLFIFTIFFKMSDNDVLIEGDIKILPSLKISDRRVIYGIIDYRDCSPYLDASICSELFEGEFEETFNKIHKEYFDNL